jgi:hypothetical protein
MPHSFLSPRTIWSSFAYLGASLLLVFFGNEGGENTPWENLAFRGLGVSVLYYLAQIGLMLGYLRFHRLGWGVSAVVVVLVALLRSMSSGVAILTVAMVMGREVVTRKRETNNM